MRQAKRLFYIVLLNIIISAVTIIAVLQWWERRHPSLPIEVTPVVIVITPTQSDILPVLTNNLRSNQDMATDSGVPITGTIKATPTFGLLSYQVKEGDFLGALAIQFNVSVADILAVNGLSDPNSLYIGQIIYIPNASLPTATATSLPPTPVLSPTPRPAATTTPRPSATATPTQLGQEPNMVIDKVVGAGVLETERVQLVRSGVGELSLAGWHLEDGKGYKYTFPDLTLYTGSAINLNTRAGQDTVIDLFWGLNSTIWKSGKIVYLYDAQNELRANYSIP
ncbi:MAG: LysM peptidoglycan-binding domain-containing protein [Anaerolineae bacterium]|nr:LysM peptidoglycan-binding domain-containing protein [Anaerolineae bacterium]